MICDPVVEEVRRVREKLIAEHGGFDGYFRHLQALDQARIEREKKKARKKTESGPAKRKQTVRVRKA